TGRADLLHVVQGARDHWIGILHRRGGMAYATPYRDDGEWWLRVAANDAGDARDGEVVELVPAQRRRRTRAEETPFARVTRRIGRPGEPDADFAAIVWRHRLPVEFPVEVEAELRDLASAASLEPGRLDLRATPFVTIDPPDARDFDDAVFCDPAPDGGLRLFVAVADVSHYVPFGSALDREAFRRGNSVYFPERAIPMLPPLLSGDLCSLRPGVERLALVAELHCDEEGATRSASFHAARIRSAARLTYAEAQSVLETGRGPHAGMLRTLASWAAAQSRERRRRGGLDFELPGVEIAYGASGRPDSVRRSVRSDAHRLVEEAMLAANRAVAEWLAVDGLPVPYRNHEPPTAEDALLLAEHLRALGVAELPPGALSSRALERALERTPPDRVAVVHALVLRHLRQARYGATSLGHFALAMRHYLHFTSPIRRYADLVVHRALKARLADAGHAPGAADSQRICARVSFRERLAQRAEREMGDLASCAFLQGHVGEEHDGTISGLGRIGLFVTLDAWPIDGVVHASRLGDAEPDALGHMLRTRGRSFHLGERIRVRIAAVDIARARIEFELLESDEAQPRGGGGATRVVAGARKRSRPAATL
ncbi:MAG TPA: VacB/RNase II family 3'-5' exoribonuclease, partial [Myxococcota bacterium]|nr:VacB/RNase II family 3'-5' exoribonuclease [Myxococcota bacterium]